MKFTERLKKSPKAFSLWAMASLATIDQWWPAVEFAASGGLGENAKTVASFLILFAGVMGWAIPQKSISGK